MKDKMKGKGDGIIAGITAASIILFGAGYTFGKNNGRIEIINDLRSLIAPYSENSAVMETLNPKERSGFLDYNANIITTIEILEARDSSNSIYNSRIDSLESQLLRQARE